MELKDIIKEYNLNDLELQVLRSLANQMMDCTSGDFGYVEDADRCGMTPKQFAGYIGALTKKGVFEYHDEDFDGQYALKPEILQALI